MSPTEAPRSAPRDPEATSEASNTRKTATAAALARTERASRKDHAASGRQTPSSIAIMFGLPPSPL